MSDERGPQGQTPTNYVIAFRISLKDRTHDDLAVISAFSSEEAMSKFAQHMPAARVLKWGYHSSVLDVMTDLQETRP